MSSERETSSGVDLYQIGETPSELRSALMALRQDFDSHNHDGSSSRTFQTVIAETLSARAISIHKTSFTDNTAGMWAGLVGATMKLFLGDGTNSLKWDGTTITIVGSITASSGTIGGFTIVATTLSAVSGGNTTILSSGATAFSAGPTGSPSITITQAGVLTATGGTITGGTIQTASSGTRFVMTAATQHYETINANGDTVATMNWSSTTAAVLKLTPTHDARRALEIIIPASFAGAGAEADAKCITIDNASDSICIDMTDAGSTAISIVGHTTRGIFITHAGTGEGVYVSAAGSTAAAGFFGGGAYPALELEQNGTSTNSFGIRLTQSTAAVKDGIFIDCNADSNVVRGMYIDRDANVDAQAVSALRLDASNLGTGTAVGIDFAVYKSGIFRVDTDNTDPTGGGGAATGRIPILVAGTARYLAYY